jgi:hypothetical protein
VGTGGDPLPPLPRSWHGAESTGMTFFNFCGVFFIWNDEVAGFRPDDFFFSLPNPFGHTRLGFTQPLTEMSTRKCFWGVECGRRVMLTILPPSVSRLSRQCGTF